MGSVLRILPHCQELKFVLRRLCLLFDVASDFDLICVNRAGGLKESQCLDILKTACHA